MLARRIDVVHRIGAAYTDMVRARCKHEIDGELAAIAEQVDQGAFAVSAVEDIAFLDPDPRHRPAFGA